MDSIQKEEIHILLKKSTMGKLQKEYNQTHDKTTFSRFIENALIFYLTEKGAKQ